MSTTTILLYDDVQCSILLDTILIGHHNGQSIALPSLLDDDRPHVQWIQTYQLQGTAYSPNGDEVAQYYRYMPGPHELRTGISYLMASPWGQSIVAYGNGWQSLPPPTPIVGFFSTPPLLRINYVPTSELEASTQREPDCHCDIRVLMSSGHQPGCSWKTWRDSRK